MEFEEIIALEQWQKIQDILSVIIQNSFKLIDYSGRIIGRPSNVASVCAQVVTAESESVEKCWLWPSRVVVDIKDNAEYHELVCPFGLKLFLLPININQVKIAYFLIGPFKQNLAPGVNILKQYVANEQDFFTAVNQLPALDYKIIADNIDFLRPMISYLKQLASFQGKYKKEIFVLNQKNVGIFLKAFLKLCINLCHAEFGSVMVFEKSTQQFSIKDFQGLDKEIVDKIKINPGEGIAGLTIKRKQPFFINDQLSDREVRLRMYKPEIKSAFVIPVFYKGAILGVVSVSTAKYPNRFSDKLMELINELMTIVLEKLSKYTNVL